MHGTDFAGIREFFEGAEGPGYTIFHRKRNHWGCGGYKCVEYAFIHLREARRLFDST